MPPIKKIISPFFIIVLTSLLNNTAQADASLNLKTSVESRKSVQSIGALRKAMKALFTNQVITASLTSLCTPMVYPSCSHSTEVFRLKNKAVEAKAVEGKTVESKIVENKIVENKISAFANKMSQQHQFDRQSVLEILNSLTIKQNIIDKMNNPAESLPWYQYRPIWMKEQRITDGVEFYTQYQTTLEKAEKDYGVDAMMIVAIIGIESFYGAHQGNDSVLEALYTLGFHYPKREAFFISELESFFLLAREQSWEISEIKGSYAGAMGMGQFIASSYRAYGIDFNQDGKVDLFNDPVDMIGSIAHYFSQHGWTEGAFIAKKVDLEQHEISTFLQKSLTLTHTLADFEQANLQHATFNLPEIEDKEQKAGLFEFQLENEAEYWLVAQNFYVITRYNHNAMYALAAFQLSQAIQEKRLEQQAISKKTGGKKLDGKNPIGKNK